MPPYLAGREEETAEFQKLLEQSTILENMVLTGLRGVGKTVLLESFKPLAISEGWIWVGTDLSESVSVSEAVLATRLLTDLSVVTSGMSVGQQQTGAGFTSATTNVTLNFQNLAQIYVSTPGLPSDKMKAVLEVVAGAVAQEGKRGIIFAYDEAQNLADSPAKDEFPLSLMLDVFQSIQRKNIPFMLVLTGLPTLFPKLVEARTFSERMFRVVQLDRLEEDESREAILKPIETTNCPVGFSDKSVQMICVESGGYPYFIQFICREVYDTFIQQVKGGEPVGVPLDAITRKLDTDFFTGRWAKATDRQRELLWAIAHLDNADGEFSVQDIVAVAAEHLANPFGASHVSQMLAKLGEAGLVYKNRWGKYSFAVPLFSRFVIRQTDAIAPEPPV